MTGNDSFVTLANGFHLPKIGLGTFSIHCSEYLSKAMDCGCLMFDTAAKYGNEKELGLALQQDVNKDSIVVITKVNELLYLGRRRFLHLDRKSIKTCFKNASKQLCGRHPDVFLLHSVFKGYTDAYSELFKLYEQGEVKAIGICNCLSIEELENIKDKCGHYPIINQIEVHPYHYPQKMIDFCKNQGIQVIARSPLAHGDILDEMEDKLIEQVRCYSKTPAQIILRWLFQKDIVTIARTCNIAHLQENISVSDFALSEKDMRYIDSLNKNQSFGYFSKRHLWE